MVRSGGLKGRLRRALSFNAASTLNEVDDGDDGKLNSRRKALANASKVNAAATATAAAASSSSQASDTTPPGSPTTPTGPSPPPVDTKGKTKVKRSLFNSKINASTDNISLSSTVSSASVMIRKLGNMGRLARKNSLMSITGLFGKDKDKDKRGAAAEASVSHATAEVDRMGDSSDSMSGLTPAARLARQHTLKSNEEAAKRKAAEAEAARLQQERLQQTDAAEWERVPRPNPAPVWERGTKNKRGEPIGSGAPGAVIHEDDEAGSGSDSGDSDETYDPHQWGGDEDVTIRVGQAQAAQNHDDEEAWAVGIRRSVERTRRPGKGILKSESVVLHPRSPSLTSRQTRTRTTKRLYLRNPKTPRSLVSAPILTINPIKPNLVPSHAFPLPIQTTSTAYTNTITTPTAVTTFPPSPSKTHTHIVLRARNLNGVSSTSPT